MSISVKFEEQTLSYGIYDGIKKIDNLPLTYLNGSNFQIGKREIELAYQASFGSEEHVDTTDLRKRHSALSKLGLIVDNNATFEFSAK